MQNTQQVVKKGVWVEKPRRMPILDCKCGNKYIQTRKNQDMCLKCLIVR